jgi:FMN-dependent NADH-azoreductase
MPTLLDVYATPRNALSRTQKLRQAFVAGYREKHPGFVHLELDLAAHHAELPAFDEWDIQAKFEMAYGAGKLDEVAAKRWNRLTELTDQLHAADLLLISAPMWNFGVPWMLKRWVDCVVQGRLTFEFVNGQFSGLLKGKRAVILTSRDGAYGPGTPYAAMDFAVPYLRTVLGLMGYGPIEAVIAEPMVMGGPEVGAAALEKAVLDAGALGKTL